MKENMLASITLDSIKVDFKENELIISLGNKVENEQLDYVDIIVKKSLFLF